jgi:hypothetical protein
LRDVLYTIDDREIDDISKGDKWREPLTNEKLAVDFVPVWDRSIPLAPSQST